MQTGTNQAAQLFGYDVIDSEGKKIGSVDNVWVDDATNDLEFIGVKTGWLMGKTHVIPTASAQIADGTVTVPYTEAQVKDAPSFGGDEELSPEQEDEIYGYYGLHRSAASSPTGLPSGTAAGAMDQTTGETGAPANVGTSGGFDADRSTDSRATGEDTTIPLSEEELQVGKQQVEAGRVRVRKVVQTEHQEVPVELRREQVSVERVDASETDVPDTAFQEGEVEVPVMREEPVVSKEAHVTGGVRLNKNVETETRSVGGDVRREDVVTEDGTDNAPANAADTYSGGNDPRNQP